LTVGYGFIIKLAALARLRCRFQRDTSVSHKILHVNAFQSEITATLIEERGGCYPRVAFIRTSQV
jgi:hypothetical protein